MKALKYALAATLFALLAACGGGGESGGYEFIALPTYGSIAINQTTGAAGITANYSSQRTANNEALSQCGFSCITALEIGSNLCGALARSTTRVAFGWASDRKLSDAKSKAMASCQNNNGGTCEVVLDKCNS
jgi:hypothetical protein